MAYLTIALYLHRRHLSITQGRIHRMGVGVPTGVQAQVGGARFAKQEQLIFMYSQIGAKSMYLGE